MGKNAMTNRALINKSGAISTDTVTHGLLNKEQSKRFLMSTFDKTPLSQEVRKEFRDSRKGEIDKIGIKSRILMPKIEGKDDGKRAQPTFSAVEYDTVAAKVPWEITGETLRENIEGEGLEQKIERLMTTQVGVDREDLCLNGDTATDDADEDAAFLQLNDGWVKQIADGGHVVDYAGKGFSENAFFDGLMALPSKYNDNNLRWIMSPTRYQKWQQYLTNKAVTVGGVVTGENVVNPAGVPVLVAPKMPHDSILLTNPKNLIVVHTYNTIIRKTDVGATALLADKRFYITFFDFDAIVEELDATAIIKNIDKAGA